MLHQNFVMHTCDDVIAEFIQSANYDVFKSNEENVVALVKRKNEGRRPFRPFRFSHVRMIMKCNDRLACSCCATIVHGRPCRHLLAYNAGALEPSDFSHVHTKAYAAKLVHSNEHYHGVVNRRLNLDLPEYHEDEDEDEDEAEDTIPVRTLAVPPRREAHLGRSSIEVNPSIASDHDGHVTTCLPLRTASRSSASQLKREWKSE